MKRLILLLLVLIVSNKSWSQAPEFSVQKVIQDNSSLYSKTDSRHKIDTVYFINLKEWNFNHFSESISISAGDSLVRSYINTFKIEPNRRYDIYLNGKLIQIIKTKLDSSYNYQEFVNEMNKFQLSYSNPKDFSLTIRDEYEMEKRTIFQDSTSYITIDYNQNSEMQRYFGTVNKGKNSKMTFDKKWDENGKYIKGEMIIYSKEKDKWKVLKTKELDFLEEATDNY